MNLQLDNVFEIFNVVYNIVCNMRRSKMTVVDEYYSKPRASKNAVTQQPLHHISLSTKNPGCVYLEMVLPLHQLVV